MSSAPPPGPAARGPLPSPALAPGIPTALDGWLVEGVRVGLAPMTAALAALGRPDGAAPALLLTGTNGKGSTACFIAACLRAAGLRVGSFTSPPLARFEEHIAVDGRPPGAGELEEHARALVGAAPEPLTAFEAAACLAFLCFQRAQVDVAVVEVGMGGRGDATNVIDPAVSVLTNVALDHQAALGPTLRAIAAEKAGVGRPGRPLITAATGAGWRAAREAAAAQGLRLVRARPAVGGWRSFRWPGAGGRETRVGPVRLGLVGDHQAANAAIACEALAALADAGVWAFDGAAVAAGLEGARLPGRLALVEEQADLWFDGAHNPAGARALAAAVADVIGEPVHGILGAFSDKDVEGMARAMAPGLASLTTVSLPLPRGAAASELASRIARGSPGLEVASCPGLAEAVARARGLSPRRPILVWGSLSLFARLGAAVGSGGGR